MDKFKNMCIDELKVHTSGKVKFKDIQIEATDKIVDAISLLTGYNRDFLLDRLQECVEDEGINLGIVSFVGISLERDW